MSRRPGMPSSTPSSPFPDRPVSANAADPEEAAAEQQVAAGLPYVVESKWCGWGGGWGSEGDIARIINRRAAQGYRLVSTKSEHYLCWVVLLIPWWRVKLLMIFERV